MRYKILALLCTITLLSCPVFAQAEYGRIDAYRSALEQLYYDQTFPDGMSDPDADVENNSFAVSDVDGDGQAELVIRWDATIMAAACGAVYDYDVGTNTLRCEYFGSAYFDFYDDGTIEAMASHNQGYADEFWPYRLFLYDAALDTYEYVSNVEGWDRQYWEEAGRNDGSQFPYSADVDGNGMVYYVGALGEAWVDDADYSQWRDSFGVDRSALNVAFDNLTLENINKLG